MFSSGSGVYGPCLNNSAYDANLWCRFFMYYWINGQTFVGPETDNEQYKEVKPETWEEYLSKRSLEQLPHAYFSLAN